MAKPSKLAPRKVRIRLSCDETLPNTCIQRLPFWLVVTLDLTIAARLTFPSSSHLFVSLQLQRPPCFRCASEFRKSQKFWEYGKEAVSSCHVKRPPFVSQTKSLHPGYTVTTCQHGLPVEITSLLPTRSGEAYSIEWTPENATGPVSKVLTKRLAGVHHGQ